MLRQACPKVRRGEGQVLLSPAVPLSQEGATRAGATLTKKGKDERLASGPPRGRSHL